MFNPINSRPAKVGEKHLTVRTEEFFVFLWQFPADLERPAGCQQSIFFLYINEQMIFSPHFIEQTIFLCQLCEQIIFLRKKTYPPPPGIKSRAPKHSYNMPITLVCLGF